MENCKPVRRLETKAESYLKSLDRRPKLIPTLYLRFSTFRSKYYDPENPMERSSGEKAARASPEE